MMEKMLRVKRKKVTGCEFNLIKSVGGIIHQLNNPINSVNSINQMDSPT
jgi:hypothetical protein